MWHSRLKRKLTPPEEKLFNGHQCIVCGQRVLSIATNKEGKHFYPFECRECLVLGARGRPGRDFGPRRAGVGMEFRSRMGYSSHDGAAPAGKDEDDEK